MVQRRRVKAAVMEVDRQTGLPVVPTRKLTAVECLATAGELGDDVARLLAAASWFAEQANRARVRGRLSASSLVSQQDAVVVDAHARTALAQATDALGYDAWNALVTCIVWEISPAHELDKALLRAALTALSTWLRSSNTKNPL
jgi:hypothetical protein